MPKGVYDRKKDDEMAAEPKEIEQKLFPVILKKNYQPLETTKYEIVGYLKPKVERKDSAGKMLQVEPEKFIEGEMHPPPLPGTGFPNKIWAGTHVKLPVEDAKWLVSKGLAERADVIAA